MAGIVGRALEKPLEDISGGAWRKHRYSREDVWPAANIQQERRKFLTRTSDGFFLAKFAGLGEIGKQKLQRARLLQQGSFVPEVVGLRQASSSKSGSPESSSINATSIETGCWSRSALILDIVRAFYRATTCAALPSTNFVGWLSTMHARHWGGRLVALEDRLAEGHALEARVRRVDTDNRMHVCEWLVAGGRLIKTDALDHSSSHDLVGHQDITWDIAAR